MVMVTNNLAHRPVAVRTGGKPKDGGDVLVEIPALASREVKDFEYKIDPVHKHMVETREITVGGDGVKADKKATSEEANAKLLADLDEAQTKYKQAEDVYEAARKAHDDAPTDETRKAGQMAKADLKKAGDEVGRAQAAFEKGA